jgi:hypothetical protein
MPVYSEWHKLFQKFGVSWIDNQYHFRSL